MSNATINGRQYEMTAQETGEALKADMIRRGWDGKIYQGISNPTGRQRKTFRGLFFRSAVTGDFVSAV